MRTRSSAITGEHVQITSDGHTYARITRRNFSVLVPLDLAHQVADALVDLVEGTA